MKFSILARSVIGIPKKMIVRKFYGSHFRTLTVHAPETFRLVCLRSLIPEQEERSFGDFRRISLYTANRQCGRVIDNPVLRYNDQQRDENRKDYIRQQESVISQQSKYLPKSRNSYFELNFIKGFFVPWREHMVVTGEVMFHDGLDEPESQIYPQLLHLRSTTAKMQKQRLDDDWRICLRDSETSDLCLPLYKIKVYEEGFLSRTSKNEGSSMYSSFNIMKYIPMF